MGLWWNGPAQTKPPASGCAGAAAARQLYASVKHHRFGSSAHHRVCLRARARTCSRRAFRSIGLDPACRSRRRSPTLGRRALTRACSRRAFRSVGFDPACRCHRRPPTLRRRAWTRACSRRALRSVGLGPACPMRLKISFVAVSVYVPNASAVANAWAAYTRAVYCCLHSRDNLARTSVAGHAVWRGATNSN